MKTMVKKIYEDDKRTATFDNGYVVIFSKIANKTLPGFGVSRMICDERIQPGGIRELKKAGQKPSDYKSLCRFGKKDVLAPVDVAEKIYSAAKQAEKEENQRLNDYLSKPVNKERRAIAKLFEKANRIENSGREDNVSRPMELRSEAKTRKAAWRETYPEAAKEEDIYDLESKARELRSKAAGALIYDADGWLSEEEQQKSHDKLIKKAEQIEAKAKELLIIHRER